MPVSSSDFITLKVSENRIQEAKDMRLRRDQIYGNVFTENDSDMRYCGDLGEMGVNHLLSMIPGVSLNWMNQDQAAGIGDFEFCGIDLDVKTVKRKVPIRAHYQAQITAKHAQTPVDWLIFACYQYPVQRLHILGAISKKDFLEQATYYGPGDKVHENYTIREGHEIYSIVISKLMPFREFVKLAKGNQITKSSQNKAAA